jgi:enoyl-CoA hydratase
MQLDTLLVSIQDHIATVRLNRPDKANAMNATMRRLPPRLRLDGRAAEARVAVLEGEGKHFTAGIDLAMMGPGAQIQDPCDGRTREALRRVILDMQDTLTSLERCRKPVLAAIHGACVGGGIDLICAADMRYCSADASFSIKEIDIGMVADVGTLQRLPKLIGARAWCASWPTPAAHGGRRGARDRPGQPRVRQPRGTAGGGARDRRGDRRQVAAQHSRHQGKLNYARDHSVADGLNYIATWNAAMLMSEDLSKAVMAGKGRRRSSATEPPRSARRQPAR